MNDWQPEHYLKFRSERTQPSIDLVSRILPEQIPERIIDVGCGPGNSTQVLLNRWPEAKILGIDSSPNMIDRAKREYTALEWGVADISHFSSEVKYDIVYSNAVIQWLPDHETLLGTLHGLTSDHGILAVQVPMFSDMPLGKSIEMVAGEAGWRDKTAHCKDLFTFHSYGYYYDILCKLFMRIAMWETEYFHVMQSHEAIIEWIKSTGMKPFLDALSNDAEKCEFSAEVLEKVKSDYPAQNNGKVLFPFRRLFFIGYRG